MTGAILKHYGIDYFSVDVSDRLHRPDVIGSIAAFKTERTFDLVSAFQTLEHNPPKSFVPHLQKMATLSNRYVFISLPYSGRWISFSLVLNIPRLHKFISHILTWTRSRPIPRPLDSYRQSNTPYRHHWFEVGDRGFKEKDIARMAEELGLSLMKSYHSSANPFHIFFLFKKTKAKELEF